MERQSPLPLSPPCTPSHQQLATLQEARLSGHYANQRWTLLPGGASGDCSGSSTCSARSAISHRVREGIPRKWQKEKPRVKWTLPRPSLRIASAAIDHIYRATVTEEREEEVCCGRQSRSGWERKERQSRTEKAREIWRQREGWGGEHCEQRSVTSQNQHWNRWASLRVLGWMVGILGGNET